MTYIEILKNIELVHTEYGRCWNFKKKPNSSGYPTALHGIKTHNVHRISYMIFIDDTIEKDIEVHHKCRNKLCVNPTHLQALTRAKHNSREIRQKKVSSHCKYGHEMTVENTISWTTKEGWLNRQCRKCKEISNTFKFPGMTQKEKFELYNWKSIKNTSTNPTTSPKGTTFYEYIPVGYERDGHPGLNNRSGR